MISDLLAEVAETLDSTTRVQVIDSTGPGEPTRKRRNRRPVLADQHDPEALMQLRAALALSPGCAKGLTIVVGHTQYACCPPCDLIVDHWRSPPWWEVSCSSASSTSCE
ncbi:hypothetical protein [Micromonospora sp. NPDC005161]